MNPFMDDVGDVGRTVHASEEEFFSSLDISSPYMFENVVDSDQESPIEEYFQDCFDDSAVFPDTSYAIEERFIDSVKLVTSKVGNFIASQEQFFSMESSTLYIFVDDLSSEQETTIEESFQDCFDEFPVHSYCNEDTSYAIEERFFDSVEFIKRPAKKVPIQSNDQWALSILETQERAGVPLRKKPDEGEYNNIVLSPEQTIILIDSTTFEP